MFFQATPRVSARAAWYSVLRYRQIGTSPGSVVKSRKVAPTMKVEGRQTVHAKGRRAAERAREQRAADLRLRDSALVLNRQTPFDRAIVPKNRRSSASKVFSTQGLPLVPMGVFLDLRSEGSMIAPSGQKAHQ